ncbi:Pol polyprotein [Elysia marginata]|uniref:Pol polyprotein n=1 Tax=Elysia marginata TaxID=1093978 RepID=A0AAV4JNL3_9GAST|nr:Pol polyprotein [Elysia marginata]
MSTREEIVQEVDLLGYQGEKREEYLKQEFKVLAERAAIARKDELEAERAAKKEEEERAAMIELEKMRLETEMKMLQAKIQAGIVKDETVGNASRFNDASVKHPKLPHFQDGKDDLDIWLKRFERSAKCLLGSSTIDFLGHRLGQGTISLQDENVEEVRYAPRPKTKKEVRAFLGLVGYYKEFVPNFAAISARLSDLVRKGQPNTANWTDSQKKAYNSLKFEVTSKPVLQLPDINKRFLGRFTMYRHIVLLIGPLRCHQQSVFSCRRLLELQLRGEMLVKPFTAHD